MIRLAYWIVLSLLATLAIAWLISLPGTLTLEFMGLRMQPRLGVAAFLVIGFVIAVLGLWTLLGRRQGDATSYMELNVAAEREAADRAVFSLEQQATGLAAARAAESALTVLKTEGTSDSPDLPLFEFSEFNTLIGFEAVWEFERRWARTDEAAAE